jgi:excisionase family DNA binding protein
MTPGDQQGLRLLTATELAAYLQVHIKTVYAWVARGELPSIRVGRQVRFSQDDILRWVSARKEG